MIFFVMLTYQVNNNILQYQSLS